MNGSKGVSTPDKRLAAVCGLFCPACTLYIGTHEDPERLKPLSRERDRSVEDVQCDGCRSDRLCFFCRENCRMVKCAAERKIDFCSSCADYPCADLKAFQAEKPHRIELFRSLELIRDLGWEEWYGQMLQRFSCPQCGTLNSAYDIGCRKCGTSPSCEYVSLHQDETIDFIRRTRGLD